MKSRPQPTLSLAPMQDVSTLPLWNVMSRRGGPDIYVTEYFRVHENSHPSAEILRSITDNETGKQVIAQMIGNEPVELVRVARELQERSNCVGVDVNLGCPAPRICGKLSGGALLRDHNLIREIAMSLRPVVKGSLTFKTRVGFESESEFEDLLAVFKELPLDGLAIHGRTVREKYQSDVHTDEIAKAVSELSYPVSANGSVVSVKSALAMWEKTGAAGLMIGRGAIRNPWIFDQIREAIKTGEWSRPTLLDLKIYITELYEAVAEASSKYHERGHVTRMKKFMNYITSGISGGQLTDQIRRAQTADDFWKICEEHLNSDEPMEDDPFNDGRLFCGFEVLAKS